MSERRLLSLQLLKRQTEKWLNGERDLLILVNRYAHEIIFQTGEKLSGCIGCFNNFRIYRVKEIESKLGKHILEHVFSLCFNDALYSFRVAQFGSIETVINVCMQDIKISMYDSHPSTDIVDDIVDAVVEINSIDEF